MRYLHLPPVGSLGAPDLPYRRSPNQSDRSFGRAAEIVFCHRWSGGSFDGTVSWLCKGDSAPGESDGSQASSHVVYAGEHGPDAGKAVQLVPWSRKAWTECDLNSLGLSVEFGDAMWLHQDPEGFARGARLVALLCHLHGFPGRWVRGDALLHGSAKGIARHADGGRLGCGHTSCPTTDLDLFGQFAERVTLELRHGDFRNSWGKAK